MELRPYQREAIEAVYGYLRRHNDNPCVVIPTAGGKTPVMATICKDAVMQWNGRVLILAHVKELLEQTADKLNKVCPEVRFGIYSAGLKRRDTGQAVIVAGIQSVYKRACELDAFDLVVIDECCPAETEITTPNGPVPIERIRAGDSVVNALGVGEVLATSARPARDLLTLEFSDGTQLTCTDGHPVFTEQGWVAAGFLELGTVAFGIEDLRLLQARVWPLEQNAPQWSDESNERAPLETATFLLKILLQEAQQSDGLNRCPTEGQLMLAGTESSAADPGWKRASPSSPTAGASDNPGTILDSRIRGADTNAEGGRLAHALQDRSGEPGDSGRHRSRWALSQFHHQATTRSPENSLPCGKRLVRVTHHERTRSVVVYNLHVAGHPSYVANGVLVHNCHLIPEEGDGMYRQFLAEAKTDNPHLRIIGFTATPFRLKTGAICTPDGFLNHVCFEVGVRELIVQGYLCPLVTKAGKTKVDTSGLHVRGGEFVAGEVENLMDQGALVDAACAEIVQQTATRNAVLIFASGVKHGEHVVSVLKAKHGIDCGFVTGETPARERDTILARFRAGALKYLTNVNVLTTGFDAPHIDCVALVRPTLSPGLYYQMCLDMETEVLTPRGWRRCHEVTTGDVVASFDLATEEIVYAPALDKVHRPLRAHESMLGVTSPHLDIRVTDRHNLVVRGRARSCLHWHLQPASEVAARREMFMIPVAGRGASHQVDAPLTDMEIAFVGWFLTDGYRNRANDTVTISQSAAKHADVVRSVLIDCGFGFAAYRQTRKGRLRGYVDGLQFVIARGTPRGERGGGRGWNALATWLDKDIPAVYDTLSVRQFGILLYAMNLANGANRKTIGYRERVMSISVGCRRRMADRIQQLAVERGYRCNISTVDPAPSDWNAHPQRQWLVRVKQQQRASVGGTREDRSPLGAKRCRFEAVPFTSNEWVWCLTTEKGTLVTRRNGKVAIVGNCGRGFRLHPGKKNCLVLDFGGNVLRHGPVDQVRVTERANHGNGQAPAKECPECHSVIAAGYAVCPDCGHAFPAPERGKHDAKASEAGILTGQVTTTTCAVQDILYSVHKKRGAGDEAPRSMRVDYKVGMLVFKSEWICFEHHGYAHQKAVHWWKRRSHEPVPDAAEKAVEVARSGRLAPTLEITMRSVAGDTFDRIIGYVLGDIPHKVEHAVSSDALDFPFGYNAANAEDGIPW